MLFDAFFFQLCVPFKSMPWPGSTACALMEKRVSQQWYALDQEHAGELNNKT